MPATHKVKVPKAVGEALSVSYAGDKPVAYKVTDGHATVQDEHLNAFLGAVEGSTVAGDTAASSKEQS